MVIIDDDDDDDDPEAFSRGIPLIPGSNQRVTWWQPNVAWRGESSNLDQE